MSLAYAFSHLLAAIRAGAGAPSATGRRAAVAAGVTPVDAEARALTREVLMGVAAVPVALLFLLFWNQESMLYVPRKGQYSQRPADVKPLDNYEELTLVGLDGTKITAWFIKQHDRASEKHSRSYRTCPTIIFLVRAAYLH